MHRAMDGLGRTFTFPDIPFHREGTLTSKSCLSDNQSSWTNRMNNLKMMMTLQNTFYTLNRRINWRLESKYKNVFEVLTFYPHPCNSSFYITLGCKLASHQTALTWPISLLPCLRFIFMKPKRVFNQTTQSSFHTEK